MDPAHQRIAEKHGSDMKNKMLIGLDVGSTTVKYTMMNESLEIIESDYRRHTSNQQECVLDLLNQIENKYAGSPIELYTTGSGGRMISNLTGGSFIQEVNAVTLAVETRYPDVRSVIELGGQDAKVILWSEDSKGNKTSSCYMNDKCAGGTGVTLDRLITKIGLTEAEASAIQFHDRKIYPVAAKCGVFAETDIIGLLKSGVNSHDIFISLCAAVVRQNLEVLVKGNILKDDILLLGGPHNYFPALRDIWIRYIQESRTVHRYHSDKSLDSAVIIPENARFFAAIGAVIFGTRHKRFNNISDLKQSAGQYRGTEPLHDYLKSHRITALIKEGQITGGPAGDPQELKRFLEQYTIPEWIQPELPSGQPVDCRLGIDGGSTSTKLVLIDSASQLIYRDYLLSMGNPIEDLKTLFSRLLKFQNDRGLIFRIVKTGVTGYASGILRSAFGLDISVVETIAHVQSALRYFGEIDVICDVGGQDIKVLFLKDGRIKDFCLNTQCSAGNGYFLQSLASQFGIDIRDYAKQAFQAEQAPVFHYGCAVFMEQDRVHFQQMGWSKQEIMAGLAQVLPLNIWNFVVQDTSLKKFGQRFLLQGGTQKNAAAVKAQVDYIKENHPEAEVIVHPYADIAGALGAALESESLSGSSTRFIGLENAASLNYRCVSDTSTVCPFCPNHCQRTRIFIENEGIEHSFFTGAGCEKGNYESVTEMKEQMNRNQKGLNLLQLAKEQLFAAGSKDHSPLKDKRKIKMRENISLGIPRLLNHYVYAPFFRGYFSALGIGRIIFSPETTLSLWNEGNKFGANDPCFPVKVAPAHIF
jgi:predicted CoA-substrate-specific enzyme activase